VKSVTGKPLFIALDQRVPLEDGMNQLKFISHNLNHPAVTRQKSKVFKDYILSSEVYQLPSVQ
jgi:hypothetical protein